MILVALINHVLCLAVTVEIIRYKVVVTVVRNSLNDGIEVIRFTECAVADGVEDTLELGVNLEFRAIPVSMTKVFDILRKVTKEEDVVFTNFTSDFNLKS